jgi:FKBP-type peptidyl-prolyl cis-trans isomerase
MIFGTTSTHYTSSCSVKENILNVAAAKLYKNWIAIFILASRMSALKTKFMKIILFAMFFFLVAAGFMGCASKPKPSGTVNGTSANKMAVSTNTSTNVLSDDKAKASYAIGMIFGHNLQQQGIEVDSAVLLRGLKDMQSGGTTLMTPQEAQAAIKNFQEKVRAEQTVNNRAEGEAFLATNKNNPGVITLPDGLQYKVITDGAGATPTPESTVTVNYRGTFLNGVEFDSSAQAGHPIQLQANRVIPGWTEALTHMKVGSKWQLFIPPDLAYGEQGNRGIPPNSTLIFEVELLDTQAPAPAAPPAPLTSDIIKVPSAEEMKKGAKIETIKAEDVQKLQSQSNTN